MYRSTSKSLPKTVACVFIVCLSLRSSLLVERDTRAEWPLKHITIRWVQSSVIILNFTGHHEAQWSVKGQRSLIAGLHMQIHVLEFRGERARGLNYAAHKFSGHSSSAICWDCRQRHDEQTPLYRLNVAAYACNCSVISGPPGKLCDHFLLLYLH